MVTELLVKYIQQFVLYMRVHYLLNNFTCLDEITQVLFYISTYKTFFLITDIEFYKTTKVVILI